jgi:hypothetical protein
MGRIRIGQVTGTAMARQLDAAADNQRVRAGQLADSIAKFERACRREEYTDTDIAWQLLRQARRQLRQLARMAPPTIAVEKR